MIDLVKYNYNKFNGNGMYLALFYCALLYIYIMDKKKREALVYPSLLTLCLAMIPVSGYVIANIIIGEDVYWRIFWLLPIILVIGYTATHLISMQSDRKNTIIVTTFILVTIMLSGSLVYTKSNFQIPDNYFKIPDAAIEISEIVQEDREKTGEALDTKLAAPHSLASTIRQYDASISMVYGRRPEDTGIENIIDLADQLNYWGPDMDMIVEIILEYNCKYIVLNENQVPTSTPEESGFTELGHAQHYIVYKYTMEESE